MKRNVWLKQSRQENLIYLAIWGLLFAAPLLSLYMRTAGDSNAVFDWTEVFIVWRRFIPFLLLFLIHSFLLAPLLVHKQKRVAYFSFMAIIVVAFTFYQCSNRPEERPRKGTPVGLARKPPMTLEDKHPPHANDVSPQAEMRPSHKPHHKAPPPIIGEHDIMAVVVLILMLGGNLGVKYYFKTCDDRKRLAELERQNLEQQLEYLRYQINPHFFMNTLNNIHALVDIDPVKAKDTILELSKMMRYVLYEGNKQGVPLSRELDFVRHYVTLMQLRYTDKVRISLDMPQVVPDRQIAPLILITFIENAFKHGVSYQHESFIEVNIYIENNKLKFTCRNTIAEMPNEEKGGVGLANIRKRLFLLYRNNYILHIHDDSDIYSVGLVIPLKT